MGLSTVQQTKPIDPSPRRTMAKKKVTNKIKATKAGDEDNAVREVNQRVRSAGKKITASSTAEYFSKNLQQVGFSSPTKAVLTTVKEALDNSLDACEDHGILPEITVEIEKVGAGSMRNTDQIRIFVADNGPGLEAADIPQVFGEYLASSKFGRGRCSRGQQGIGISAATTWAMQTTATGARVVSKKKSMKKALSCIVDMDLKNNRGMLRDKTQIDWDRPHGTSVEFHLDGRIQMNGEAGLMTYLRGNILLNPHLTLHYKIGDEPRVTIERVTEQLPEIPEATEPHPHTMKLGEFMSHARLYGRTKASVWLKRGFSRISDRVIADMKKEQKLTDALLNSNVDSMSDENFKKLFAAVQKTKLLPPATNTVLSVGEDGLALSIRRLGDVDYFAVVTRKPMIADFKPVQVEVAIARLREKSDLSDSPVQVLRFANRVPLQFDKAACAIVKAITTVNWRSYGLRQPKSALPVGPYIVAVSVVSPFIKFKNASKETVDASDELVEELRYALMRAGQRLSRYLRREHKAGELEQRVQHIEQFGPILVQTLTNILGASEDRKTRATAGLQKLLERDTKGIKQDLQQADDQLADYLEKKKERLSGFFDKLEEERFAEVAARKVARAAAAADGEDEDTEPDSGTMKKPAAKAAAKTKSKGRPKVNKKAPAKKKTAGKTSTATKKKPAAKKKKTKK